jgi:2-polyprenyl-3-methyl-5-hydroxy-6-metoxy-1,4-benzoquinol methylase
MAEIKVLELGCGKDKTPGAIGLDINPCSNADIIHNLDHFPYPFGDNEFDKIICKDVLEHVENFVKVMEEIWRIAKPGARIEVAAPFMSSVNFFSDPTHKRAFTSRSFDYFMPGTQASKYQYSSARLKVLSVQYDKYEYEHRKGLNLWLLKWANRHKERYENRFAFIFPVYQIYFELEVVK